MKPSDHLKYFSEHPHIKQKHKTVWLNGTFDVLHTGHIKLFREARKLAGPGGKVIVGTDSDERIRELKGPTRPVNNLFDRIDFLRAIKYIDEVVAFSSTNALETHIKRYSPDILLIGDDYVDKPIVGAQYAKEIVYFPRYGGLSSSKIIGIG
jgi:D-beta-D-heptose 7-phosphate kinase/D-beta-D-heptose 1-phosphate adenosyltransferase